MPGARDVVVSRCCKHAVAMRPCVAGACQQALLAHRCSAATMRKRAPYFCTYFGKSPAPLPAGHQPRHTQAARVLARGSTAERRRMQRRSYRGGGTKGPAPVASTTMATAKLPSLGCITVTYCRAGSCTCRARPRQHCAQALQCLCRARQSSKELALHTQLLGAHLGWAAVRGPWIPLRLRGAGLRGYPAHKQGEE